MAISEAVEDAATHEDTKYSLGSVLNHVMLHQTVVGLETKKQLALAGEEPDILIGCVGGGSNFAGFSFPFVPDKLKGKDIKIIGVEPTACPTLTRGLYTYDFGDTAQLTPLIMMYTLGHSFVPPGIHAGGLRYHGDSPLLCLLVHEKVVEARAYPQNPVFEAAHLFAKTEGIIPAPETAHAIKGAVDEAVRCREANEAEVHRLQLLRPRPLRPGRLRRLPGGQTGGPGISSRGPGPGPGWPAQGAGGVISHVGGGPGT